MDEDLLNRILMMIRIVVLIFLLIKLVTTFNEPGDAYLYLSDIKQIIIVMGFWSVLEVWYSKRQPR